MTGKHVECAEQALAENPLVTIHDALVGLNKAKQVQGANGTGVGGEIFADYTFRLSALHSCFDDGDFIIWNVQGFGQPIRQKRTPLNLAAFNAFQSSTVALTDIRRPPVHGPPRDITIQAEPVRVSSIAG